MGKPHYAVLIGLELVAALALLIGAGVLWLLERDRGAGLAAEAAAPGERMGRRLVATLFVWLATAYVLFSFMGHLQPRYLEAMAPAVAAVLGVATAYLLSRAETRRAAWLCAGGLVANAAFAAQACGVSDIGTRACMLATVAALAGLCVAPARRTVLGARAGTTPRLRVLALAVVSLALLAAPAEASIDLVEERASDANPSGSGSQFGVYLRAHRDGARYETAATNPLAVVGLIAQDAQPVLVMRSVDGVLVSVGRVAPARARGSGALCDSPQPVLLGAPLHSHHRLDGAQLCDGAPRAVSLRGTQPVALSARRRVLKRLR